MFLPGDIIGSHQSHTSATLQGESILTGSPAGSKLISSIGMTKPLSSEQQKKRAAMLFGKLLYLDTLS